MSSLASDLQQLLSGTDEVIPAAELERKLALGRPLRIKLGLDPTAPSVTLGWAVVLRKLRQFQDLGHTAVLIVGDMTARIGDPSGKSETRPRLDAEQVQTYADELLEQLWLILDRDRTEVRNNSEWLEGLDLEGILKLTSTTTVAQMLERDDFAKRHADGKPISLMEFLYPLLQGQDSVAVESDVELGGTDQKFNLLVGRDVQRAAGQEPQVTMTMPLLVGTDGVQKMSQSLGNFVGITEPPDEMFGKLTRVPDELIGEYRRLTLDFFADPNETERVTAGLSDGSLDAWTEKKRVARELVDLYHGGAGERAEAAYDKTHKDREIPDEIGEFDVASVPSGSDGGVFVPKLLVDAGLAASASEAGRLLKQGGVKLDGVALDPETRELPAEDLTGKVLQVGRRKFIRLR